MGYRANQAFISYVDGAKRVFKRGDVVPDEVAAKVLALTYIDGVADEAAPTPKPRKKRAAKSADKFDD